jgi:hypothetical protein
MINTDAMNTIPRFPMTLAITRDLNDPKALLTLTEGATITVDRLQAISIRNVMLEDPSPEGTPAADLVRLLDEAIEEIEWLHFW